MPGKKDHVRKKKRVSKERNEHGINARTLGIANRVRDEIDSDEELKEKMEPVFAVLDGAMGLLKEKDEELAQAKQQVEKAKVETKEMGKEKEEAEVKAKLEKERADQEKKRAKELITVIKDMQKLVHELRENKQSFGDTPDCSKMSDAERGRLKTLTVAVDRLIPNNKTEAKQVDAFDVARAIAVRAYTKLRCVGVSEANARRRATAIVWTRGHGYKAKKWMKKWMEEIEKSGDLPTNQRGRHQIQRSLIQFTDIRDRVLEWCKTQRKLTSRRLRTWINTEVIPDLPSEIAISPISRGTARHWLYYLGYIRGNKTKGAYTDGHDAPTTLLARAEYIRKFRAYEPLMRKIEVAEDGSVSIVEPDLESQEAHDAAKAAGFDRPYMVVNVYHDEVTAKPADKGKTMWIRKGDSPLAAKSDGQGYMMSGFLSESEMLCAPGTGQVKDAGGRLVVDKEGNPVRGGTVVANDGSVVDSASLYWETGAKGDGYFCCDDLVGQIENRLLPVFQAKYPRDRYKALVHFDNATLHTAYAADALVASKITLNDDTKTTPKMRATTWTDGNGIEHRQEMQFADGKTKGALVADQTASYTRV